MSHTHAQKLLLSSVVSATCNCRISCISALAIWQTKIITGITQNIANGTDAAQSVTHTLANDIL